MMSSFFGAEVAKGPVIILVGGGEGAGGGENAKKFPNPHLIAFIFFGYTVRSFIKIQDPPPPSNIKPKYGK